MAVRCRSWEQSGEGNLGVTVGLGLGGERDRRWGGAAGTKEGGQRCTGPHPSPSSQVVHRPVTQKAACEFSEEQILGRGANRGFSCRCVPAGSVAWVQEAMGLTRATREVFGPAGNPAVPSGLWHKCSCGAFGGPRALGPRAGRARWRLLGTWQGTPVYVTETTCESENHPCRASCGAAVRHRLTLHMGGRFLLRLES